MSNQEREVLLEVKNLKQYFKVGKMTVKAVDNMSFNIYKDILSTALTVIFPTLKMTSPPVG